MTWVVITTQPDAVLAHAALLMSERRVGSLPVVADGRLVGVLTERDLVRAVARDGSMRKRDPEGFLW